MASQVPVVAIDVVAQELRNVAIERADTIGSRCLGVRRGAAIESAVLQHFMPVALLLGVIGIFGCVGTLLSATLCDVGLWVCSGSLFVLLPTIWLTVRVLPMCKLLKHPPAWIFISSNLVQFVLEAWRLSGNDDGTARIFFFHCLFSLLLPLIDALPHRLVSPLGRYLCPFSALVNLFRYSQNSETQGFCGAAIPGSGSSSMDTHGSL